MSQPDSQHPEGVATTQGIETLEPILSVASTPRGFLPSIPGPHWLSNNPDTPPTRDDELRATVLSREIFAQISHSFDKQDWARLLRTSLKFREEALCGLYREITVQNIHSPKGASKDALGRDYSPFAAVPVVRHDVPETDRIPTFSALSRATVWDLTQVLRIGDGTPNCDGCTGAPERDETIPQEFKNLKTVHVTRPEMCPWGVSASGHGNCPLGRIFTGDFTPTLIVRDYDLFTREWAYPLFEWRTEDERRRHPLGKTIKRMVLTCHIPKGDEEGNVAGVPFGTRPPKVGVQTHLGTLHVVFLPRTTTGEIVYPGEWSEEGFGAPTRAHVDRFIENLAYVCSSHPEVSRVVVAGIERFDEKMWLVGGFGDAPASNEQMDWVRDKTRWAVSELLRSTQAQQSEVLTDEQIQKALDRIEFMTGRTYAETESRKDELSADELFILEELPLQEREAIHNPHPRGRRRP